MVGKQQAIKPLTLPSINVWCISFNVSLNEAEVSLPMIY